MNLFPLQRRDKGMVLRGTDGPVLAPPTGAEAIGGIRPESLRLAERGIPARVMHAEYLGADTIVACCTGEATLLARLPGRVTLDDGTAIHLVSEAPIHVFDASTGHRDDMIAPTREIVRA
jgi:ABC-type sugar transport system ATPase subunit